MINPKGIVPVFPTIFIFILPPHSLGVLDDDCAFVKEVGDAVLVSIVVPSSFVLLEFLPIISNFGTFFFIHCF